MPKEAILLHVRSILFDQPWAIRQESYDAIVTVVREHERGRRLTRDEIDARIQPAAAAAAARRDAASSTPGAIAVIPVFGVMAQRLNMLEDMSGGTSTEQLGGTIKRALADSNVRAILLQVDSPGGSVFGIQELGQVIFEGRDAKPIVAIADAQAASAAYWIGSQASELVVTPSGEVGSIGVFAVHDDVSAAAEAQGIKRTFISAGKYKTEGHAFAPLDPEAAAYLQTRVDQYYDLFVQAVGRGRGVRQQVVRNGFGQGRMVGAAAALEAGMVDRVEAFDATLARLVKKTGAAPQLAAGAGEGGGMRAELDQQAADDTVPPADDGSCPDGYEKGEDGMCHLMPAGTAAAADRDRRRRRLQLLGG